MKSLIKNIKDRLKNLSKKQKIIFSIVGIVLIGVIFFTNRSSGEEVVYKFTTVSKGSVSSVISESGEIDSTGNIEVVSTINGIVDEVYIENGEEVKKGDWLFSVTSTATDEERASAYSSYQSALNNLESAKNTLYLKETTLERVYDEIVGNDDDESFEIKEQRVSAESAKDNAYLSMVSAEAALSKAWYAYQATIDGVVKSTGSGTIANFSVASGQQVNNQDTVLLIESGEESWIKLSVTENDVVDIEVGQKVDVLVDALPNEELRGEVKRVDSVGTITSGVVTFDVYILLDSSPETLRAAMTVSVDIMTSEKNDVLVVSNSAIKSYQGSKAVQILDEDSGQVLYLPIKLGVVGSSNSEVVSGLEEGQKIIGSSSSSTSDEEKSGSGGMFPMGGMKK